MSCWFPECSVGASHYRRLGAQLHLISASSTPFIEALRVAFGFVQCSRMLRLRVAAARFTMNSYAHGALENSQHARRRPFARKRAPNQSFSDAQMETSAGLRCRVARKWQLRVVLRARALVARIRMNQHEMS